MTKFMNRTLIYTLFALFATTYSSLHAAQDTLVVIHQLPRNNSTELMPLKQPDTAWANTTLKMSEERKQAIRSSLPQQFPDVLTRIVLEYADIDSTEEQYGQYKHAYDTWFEQDTQHFRKKLKTLRNQILATTVLTTAGVIELSVAATRNVSVSASNGVTIFAVGAMFGSATGCLLSCAAYPTDKIFSIQGMLGSFIIFGTSCAPIVQAYAPQFVYIPLAVTGGCVAISGIPLLMQHSSDLLKLYKVHNAIPSLLYNRRSSRCCCAIM
jgi:hypothetical protein